MKRILNPVNKGIIIGIILYPVIQLYFKTFTEYDYGYIAGVVCCLILTEIGHKLYDKN